MTLDTMKMGKTMKTLDEATRDELLKLLDDLLNELNIRNMVESFRPGLLRVSAGERATQVFSSSNRRRKLLKHGIFLKRYGHSGMEIVISPKAKRLLD